MKKRHPLLRYLWISLGVISFCTHAWAETTIHTVVEGDTLEKISIKYYGSRELWPMLWKKNPSITDPVKLKPGDTIVLLEDVPVKPVPTKGMDVRSLLGIEDATLAIKGVNVADYCDVGALGFLSPGRVKPWGVIVSDETERLFLGQYDNVYVEFDKGRKVKIGDIFNIYKESESLDHPFESGSVGFAIVYLGRIVLKEKTGETAFKAEIIESYRVMRVGDPVIPYQPVSSCIQPSNPDWEKCGENGKCTAAIVSSRDQYELMGQYSVVYLDQGYQQGIERGNLFSIVTRMETSETSGKDLPNLVLGYLMIVESRLETATGVVLNAQKDFPNGTMLTAVDMNRALERTLTSRGYGQVEAIDIKDELVPALIKLKENIDVRKDLPESLYLLSSMGKCSAN